LWWWGEDDAGVGGKNNTTRMKNIPVHCYPSKSVLVLALDGFTLDEVYNGFQRKRISMEK
jgi:hypothetical protein